jgi:AcrR family transcriptional regulator
MSRPDTSEDGVTPRRKLIREAAAMLFDERGYHGTRMRDIGSQLGMQAPSLYNHVASKQELLHELVFRNIEVMLEEHHLAVGSATNVVEKLRRAMEAHVRHCARFRLETRISSREVPSLEEPAKGELLAMRSDYSHAWKALLDEGVAEGEFKIRRTQLAANALLQMGVGVALWIRPLPLSESELAYSLGEMALRSVGVQDPPDAEAAGDSSVAELVKPTLDS